MTKNMKIAFFTPFIKQNRGNATTAKRIIAGLQSAQIEVTVYAYEEDKLTAEKAAELQACSVFHILHITRFLQWKSAHQFDLNKPYIITNGGTDVNHDLLKVNDGSLLEFLERASAICVFTDDAKKKISNLIEHSNIVTIPQSVWFPEETTSFQPPSEDGYPKVLLPAGLRKVKDVFFLVEELSKLRSIYSNMRFVIAGILIEAEVYEELIQYQQKYPWLSFYEDIPLDGMKKMYEWADVVLNTSISEGQASSILEAMKIGSVVFARRNPGNESVITDNVNGFLFSTKDEFFQKIRALLENQAKHQQVIEKAKDYIENHHSHSSEVQRYISVYRQSIREADFND